MMNVFFILLLPCLAAFVAGDPCQINNGFDIAFGSNLAQRDKITVGECCDFCKSTPGCVAWVWGKILRTCWLKRVTGPLKLDGNKVSGFVNPSPAINGGQCPAVTSDWNYAPGAQFDMRVIKGTDVATCCNSCSSTPGCKAWVWNFSNTCYLKNTDTPRVPDKPSYGTVSGLPTSPSSPDCGTSEEMLGAHPELRCYDECGKGGTAVCNCCKSFKWTGGKCIKSVPYCFK